jgi:2-polyprenyl-3-methyl-5-hydroxy-6-metoxy-1,4-benzoquinol methylase
MSSRETETAETYYDAAAKSYSKLYEPDELAALDIYPANYFRLQKLVSCFSDPAIRRVLEIGLGEGTPALVLAKMGKDVYGFDVSAAMVDEARGRLKTAGIPDDRVIRADIVDSISYVSLLKDGLFDGLVAMGVLQHVQKDELALSNMAKALRPGGKGFIMFRNKLFSLFTMNRYTYEFIMEDLLRGVSADMQEQVGKYLTSILRMDLPPPPKKVITTSAELEKPVFTQFHNPLEIPVMFERCGFRDLKLHWYHYHPAMPSLERADVQAFRREAIALEDERSGWRGMFLCSAFVVEATRA